MLSHIQDGGRFCVKWLHAIQSSQLAGMMTGPGAAEELDNLIDISIPILKTVCVLGLQSEIHLASLGRAFPIFAST